jgi:hypothetical protein
MPDNYGKNTDTHSYLILIAFPRQQRLRERASMLRYTCLVCPFVNRHYLMIYSFSCYCSKCLGSVPFSGGRYFVSDSVTKEINSLINGTDRQLVHYGFLQLVRGEIYFVLSRLTCLQNGRRCFIKNANSPATLS